MNIFSCISLDPTTVSNVPLFFQVVGAHDANSIIDRCKDASHASLLMSPALIEPLGLVILDLALDPIEVLGDASEHHWTARLTFVLVEPANDSDQSEGAVLISLHRWTPLIILHEQ